MPQSTGFGGFAIETLEHFRVAAQALVDGLDRDLAIQLAIEGAIDEAHATATEKIDHFVLSNALYSWSGHEKSLIAYRKVRGDTF